MTYIQGFVIPVPTAKRQEYRDFCEGFAHVLKELGALRVVETWGVDVPDGAVTDFNRSVAKTAEESVAFSWIVWPDKATCDAAGERMMSDESMQPKDAPFDMKRMIYGGFEPLFDSAGEF